MRLGRLVLLALAQILAPAAAVGATSVPSPEAAIDCSDLVELLPAALTEDLVLTATLTTGVELIDPDDLLDPFLASLGLGRDDLCGVSLRYGDDPAMASAGMLLRVRGTGPDLAPGVAAALGERLRAYGHEVSEDHLDVGGWPVSRLSVTATGVTTVLLVAAATPDSVLLTASIELLEAVLPSLARAPSPSVPAGASASPAGVLSPPAEVPAAPSPSVPAGPG
jgi:hypothetical protein